MKFNERLKECRIEKKLLQKDVAVLLNVSENCYGGYETGYRKPDIETLTKICRILEVSSDYLLGLEE